MKPSTGLKKRGMQREAGAVLAVLFRVLRAVCAVEELPLEELHSDDGKDEHKELVDDQDVEDVFQRRHHAVKHRLEEKNT